MDRIGFLFVTFLVSFIAVDGTGNTLNASEVLQYNQFLNSSNGRFQLGFFKAANPYKLYLGIWYTDPGKTVVWVANGNNPIINGNGTLSLSTDGTLSLRDDIGQHIWSSGTQPGTGVPQACLLDSGVLFVNDTQTGKLLWQSSYQLSDTLLPNVPIGYTKFVDSILEFQLTSWNITGVDPSPGQFVRKLDPSRRYELVAFKGSDVFYRSGPWNGTRWNGFPKMTQDLVKFNLSKSGDKGALYWYEPLNPSDLWRLVMTSNGVTYRYRLQGSNWAEFWKAPDESTPSYALCGPYGIYKDGTCKCCVDGLFHPRNEIDWKGRNFSRGCERDIPLNDTVQAFVTLRNVKLPDTINAISDDRKNKSECESLCKTNSSCMAYAYIGWQGCMIWFGDLVDMQQFLDAGDNLYIRVASQSTTPPTGTTNLKTIIIIAVSVCIAIVLVLIVIAAVFLLRQNRQGRIQETDSTREFQRTQETDRTQENERTQQTESTQQTDRPVPLGTPS